MKERVRRVVGKFGWNENRKGRRDVKYKKKSEKDRESQVCEVGVRSGV